MSLRYEPGSVPCGGDARGEGPDDVADHNVFLAVVRDAVVRRVVPHERALLHCETHLPRHEAEGEDMCPRREAEEGDMWGGARVRRGVADSVQRAWGGGQRAADCWPV